jgi:hypothetical protein
MNSWKTSLSGIAALLVALGALGKLIYDFVAGEPISAEQLSLTIVAISAAFTGLFARDNDVTSEEAGAE